MANPRRSPYALQALKSHQILCSYELLLGWHSSWISQVPPLLSPAPGVPAAARLHPAGLWLQGFPSTCLRSGKRYKKISSPFCFLPNDGHWCVGIILNTAEQSLVFMLLPSLIVKPHFSHGKHKDGGKLPVNAYIISTLIWIKAFFPAKSQMLLFGTFSRIVSVRRKQFCWIVKPLFCPLNNKLILRA